MPGKQIIRKMARLQAFGIDFLRVPFNGLLQIMNIDQLNVKLVVQVLDLQQHIFLRLVNCHVLKNGFVVLKLVSKGA